MPGGDRRRRSALWLLPLLAVSALLRFQGLDWDQGQHLHPDERFLTMVASDIRAPRSVPEYFDTARSPLNPANAGHEFFVYGTAPVFLAKGAAAAIGWDDYDHLHLVGRACSAVFDLGTILLTYALGLLLAGPAAALAATALMAFSVTSIQQAHFFTVDSSATFFATASLLMLARVALRRGLSSHLWFGVALGLTLACRAHMVLLGALYPLAVAHAWRRGASGARDLVAGSLLAVLATAVVFRVLQPYDFAGPGFFGVALAPEFVASMHTIRLYTTGAAEFPPSVQWIGRTPVLFPAWNLLTWELGPAWGLAVLAAVPWCLRRRRSAEDGAESGAGRLVLLWIPILFLFHAIQFVATGRYFLPIVPLLALAVAWWLTSPAGDGRLRRAGLVVVIALTAVWAMTFTSIYRRPHTRVEASQWIYQHVPPASAIATEHWDDALPLRLGDRTPDVYRRLELTLYDDETEAKRTKLIDTLDRADVIVLSSNRLYASIPRAPWRYPLARRYYVLLFSGELGFDLERDVTSYPALGRLQIPDDNAEEAFTVYDHPRVLIFRKTSRYASDRTARLLGAVSLAGVVRVPPRDASALYRRARPERIAIPQGSARPGSSAAGETGSIGSLVRWLGIFELLSLACFGLLLRPLAAARDRGYGLAKLIAWLGPGTLVWLLTSVGLAPNGPGTARAVAAMFVAAGGLAGWRSRDDLRRVWRLERRAIVTIEAVFLVALGLFLLVRAFNPAIFWGEKPMDFAILNATLRAASMPPADPWYAGATLSYYYFGHAVTAVFALISGVGPAFAFNLALATIAAMLATMMCVLALQVSGRAAAGVWAAVLVVAGGNLAGVRAFLFNTPDHLGFDYFWATSRVVPGTINEFPFWNLVFGDLHAHVLAMPLEAGLLYLGCLWVTRRATHNRVGALCLTGMSAWVVGAIAVTSSWSLPTVAALLLGFLLTGWRQGPVTVRGFARAAGTWIAILAGAYALFWPFWASYAPAAVVWGRVTSQFARLADVVTIFGIFLALALPALAMSLVRSTHVHAWRKWLAAASVVAAAVLGSWHSGASGLFVAWTVLAAIVWLIDTRSAVRIGAVLVGFAGALGLATETVFVWDRMNTVFKYYLEMWLLLGSGAAVLAWSARANAPRGWRLALTVAMAALTTAGLFTSATGLVGFLREPHARSAVPTLDGLAYMASGSPLELDAYQWLNREVEGIPVLLEASGPPYQAFGRVSMNTGLPTVLGWQYHLIQQGRPRDQVEARAMDVRAIYETTDPARAAALLRRYHIDLVFVGPLERQTYPAAGLAKFASIAMLQPVFQNREVTIYATVGRAGTVKTWIDAVAPLTLTPPVDAPLREPRGVAVSPDGTIVVADFGNRRVQRVGADLRPVGAFGRQGDAPGEFRDPCGIAVDSAGNVWVADTWNHRIQKFTEDGRPLEEWHADLWGPRGIAVTADGTVYVTDTGHGRVVRFTPGGESHVLIDGDALDNPVGLAVDTRGEIFVADAGHQRIAVFDQEGRQLREWPVRWRPDARMEPYLTVGPDGVVWVTDPAGRQVLLFDRGGRALGVAVATAPLGLPLGIAVRDRNTAVVADAGAGRLIEVRRSVGARQR